mgnify:CR=1 FL=1
MLATIYFHLLCSPKPDYSRLYFYFSVLRFRVDARNARVFQSNDFQYDSVFATELSPKWISVFRNRVREKFYGSRVVELISIHAVLYG